MPPETSSLMTAKGVDAGYGTMQVLWGVDLDVRPGETVLLLGANAAVKHYVQQHVAKLLFQSLPVFIGYSVCELIDLLQRLLAQGVNSLLFIPRALFPQLVHNAAQPLD